MIRSGDCREAHRVSKRPQGEDASNEGDGRGAQHVSSSGGVLFSVFQISYGNFIFFGTNLCLRCHTLTRRCHIAFLFVALCTKPALLPSPDLSHAAFDFQTSLTFLCLILVFNPTPKPSSLVSWSQICLLNSIAVFETVRS